mmetsp:Transcript_41192/g.118011  ORF Transcript_41192/g.118011 Transcript_41192/m.118011 type:complete len:229 (+) Transcript_41192:3-689(+)
MSSSSTEDGGEGHGWRAQGAPNWRHWKCQEKTRCARRARRHRRHAPADRRSEALEGARASSRHAAGAVVGQRRAPGCARGPEENLGVLDTIQHQLRIIHPETDVREHVHARLPCCVILHERPDGQVEYGHDDETSKQLRARAILREMLYVVQVVLDLFLDSWEPAGQVALHAHKVVVPGAPGRAVVRLLLLRRRRCACYNGLRGRGGCERGGWRCSGCAWRRGLQRGE